MKEIIISALTVLVINIILIIIVFIKKDKKEYVSLSKNKKKQIAKWLLINSLPIALYLILIRSTVVTVIFVVFYSLIMNYIGITNQLKKDKD